MKTKVDNKSTSVKNLKELEYFYNRIELTDSDLKGNGDVQLADYVASLIRKKHNR